MDRFKSLRVAVVAALVPFGNFAYAQVHSLSDPGIAIVAALLLLSNTAHAQVYSWKDPNTGASRLSNSPPSWYSVEATVLGPRTVVTVGNKVVDDTALPYDERQLLSGRSKEQADKARLKKR